MFNSTFAWKLYSVNTPTYARMKTAHLSAHSLTLLGMDIPGELAQYPAYWIGAKLLTAIMVPDK